MVQRPIFIVDYRRWKALLGAAQVCSIFTTRTIKKELGMPQKKTFIYTTGDR